MHKRVLSVVLMICFLISFVACTNKKTNDNSPVPDSESTTEETAGITHGINEYTTKSDEDEAFEKLSNELFVSIVTADGFTFHQLVKNSESFGISEDEVERGWGHLSIDEYEKAYRSNDDFLKRLSAVDRTSLIPINANAYDTIVETLELANETRDLFYYSEPLEPLNGSHTMLPLMMTMYEINSKDDLEGYIYLLEDMPRYISEIGAFEKEKAEMGLFMTENALDTVLKSIDNFIDSEEECFLIAFLDDVLKDGVAGLSDSEKTYYSERSRECVLKGVIPAFANLRSTLNGLRAKCKRFVGASERGEDAKKYFVSSIKNKAACNMDPDAMADMLDDTAATLLAKLRQTIYSDRDTINQLGDKKITSGDPNTDIQYLLELIKNIYPAITEQKIEYVTVPEAVAEDFSPAAYLISAFDDSKRNIVIKNPNADTRTLLFTMAHECFPGHLYQTQYVRSGGFPLAQQIATPSGYSEGWAVFSELMMASRAERYGKNTCLVEQYNSIVCNIIVPAYVSLKVNYNGWNKAAISDYLEQYGLNDENYIDVIYEYAVNMPDYFFNYGMGFACIYRIYQKVNPKTDAELKAFFSEYLSIGPCFYDVLFKHYNIKN